MRFSSQVPEHQSLVQVLGRVRVLHQGIFRVPNTSVRAVDPCKQRTPVGLLVSWPAQGRSKTGHGGWVLGCRYRRGARNDGSIVGLIS